jgi:alpha-beta hydrolase superfamily lysophospholipase
MKRGFAVLIFLVPFFLVFAQEKITFPSGDELRITADVYVIHENTAPFIVLFHRAGWSRGEYREIAPKLNELGFNCMAVDQRSGQEVNGVSNETVQRAEGAKKSTTYLDALQDVEAAINYSKEHYAKGKLIIWGSSYSASFVLKIAGDHPDWIDGVLAFAPGEYFSRFGKGDTFIRASAKHIEAPVFITSARGEKDKWWSIYETISAPKEYFLPESGGVHGSEALWKSTKENKAYWAATEKFLKRFVK